MSSTDRESEIPRRPRRTSCRTDKPAGHVYYHRPVEEIDITVRNRTYRLFADRGFAPTVTDVARSSHMNADDVAASWRRLHDAHALVLHPHDGSIRMANPFAAEPTAYRVRTGDQTWHACRRPSMSGCSAGERGEPLYRSRIVGWLLLCGEGVAVAHLVGDRLSGEAVDLGDQVIAEVPRLSGRGGEVPAVDQSVERDEPLPMVPPSRLTLR